MGMFNDVLFIPPRNPNPNSTPSWMHAIFKHQENIAIVFTQKINVLVNRNVRTNGIHLFP